MASRDDGERRILTRKELAKEQRQAAYQRAKEQRASDPRYLALKQAAKEQRRAAYQKLKQGRKAEAIAHKASLTQQRVAEHDEQRAEQLAKIERTVERARHPTDEPRPLASSPVSAAQVDTNPADRAAGLADSDTGWWRHVHWATAPKLFN